jgi:hypothetical protein
MTAHEDRYRRALRWYPATWRTANEEAVLATLLDAADDSPVDRSRAQVRNLRAEALSMRFGMMLPHAPRQRVAISALASGTAFALVYFWFQSRVSSAPTPADFAVTTSFGPFENSGVVLAALWTLAFVSAMICHRAMTREFLVASLAATVALPIAAAVGGAGWAAPSATNLALLAALNLLALLGTPTSRPRLGITALAWLAGLVAVHAVNGPVASSSDRYLWQSVVADAPLVAFIGAAAILLAAVVAQLSGRPGSSAAVLLSSAPWVGAWALASSDGNLDTLVFVAFGCLAALLVLLAALQLIARTGIRISMTRSQLLPARAHQLD